MINDGHCKSDMVMKAFIHYYNIGNLLGVLGPACSETVEPIAGLSKHLNMMVMSYSADGASFVDRKNYPYFFRTIGSNSQYVDAYMEIMHKLGWNRVSTLTEDGQQYAEFNTYMESRLKLNNFTLAFSRKFQPNVSAEDMSEVSYPIIWIEYLVVTVDGFQHLSKLKEAHSRIIIAELHSANAAIAICEAIHLGVRYSHYNTLHQMLISELSLQMTQADDFVWFLPSWLPKDFEMWELKVNHRCTVKQLRKVRNFHNFIRYIYRLLYVVYHRQSKDI